MSHDLDPYGNGTERTKPCATCGDRTSAADDNGKPKCADCMGIQERRNSAILDFHNALPADLQAAFDTADAVFDSGHEVAYLPQLREYSIYDRAHSPMWLPEIDGAWSFSVPLTQAIQWCIENREVLV